MVGILGVPGIEAADHTEFSGIPHSASAAKRYAAPFPDGKGGQGGLDERPLTVMNFG